MAWLTAGRGGALPAVTGAALVVAAATMLGPATSWAQSNGEAVYVVELDGKIDQGLPAYLDRVLAEAAQTDAAAVLLEVDTPGGRLDAALQMQSALMDTPVRTVAFVDGMALSAGALLTIAADEIYLAPGSALGAATPVLGSGEPAGEKTVSAVRATFRATARARGRNPRVAEAMVDPGVSVDGLVGAGELLTLGPREARAHGYAEQVVPDRAAALAAAGLQVRQVIGTAPRPAESLARFLTNPVVASLLVTLALWLLIADLSSGGVGVATGVAAAFFAAFFWGHGVAGLAGWEDIALVAVGLVLVAVELLALPGTGLPGLLGLAAVLGGVFLAQLGRELVTPAQLQQAAVSVGLIFLAVLAGLVVGVRLLGRHGPPRALGLTAQVVGGEPVTTRAGGGWLRWFGGQELVLAGAGDQEVDDTSAGRGEQPRQDTAVHAAAGAAEDRPSLVGAVGVTASALRPSGVAEIRGERVDVVSDGAYVPPGQRVEVVRDEGYRRVVQRVVD